MDTTVTTEPSERQLTAKQQFCLDLLCTAVEGGIGYWCQVHRYKWENTWPALFTFSTDEEPNKIRQVTTDDIEKFMEQLKDNVGPFCKVASPATLGILLSGWNDGDFTGDAGDADTVIQLIAFEDVIYG